MPSICANALMTSPTDTPAPSCYSHSFVRVDVYRRPAVDSAATAASNS